MTNSGSYSEVLKIKGVQPFLWMQFLNAFNDNIYKLVVSLLAVLVVTNKQTSGTYLSIAGFIFVAPFLIFAAYAGQLADKFEKRTVLIATKSFEIGAMVLALLALVSGKVEWMLAVLFLTATQAAFFSPAKYGIVPELVAEENLARANGLLEMSTFVAVILGTVAGTIMVAHWKTEPAYIGVVLILIAIIGTSTGFRIVRTPAPTIQRPFSWNPLGDVWIGFKRLSEDRVLMLAVLGTTFFWFMGALFQMLLLLFGKEALHCSETQIGLLLASLAVGIGTGSMAAGRLSGDKIEPGLIPVGAFGMAAAAGLLGFVAHTIPAAMILLIALGFMGGLFVVPLNAMLQHRPRDDERGRLLATANFANTLGMMCSSGVVWFFHEALHLSAAHVMAISASMTLATAMISFHFVPAFTVRFLFWVLMHSVYKIRIIGRENIPQHGPALLVSNHVSFIDGFLIGACIHRFVRYMVYETWYDKFSKPLSWIHAIRVPVGTRRSVLKTIELARQELQAGHVVCIFAEGSLTLSGNIAGFQRGMERIVDGLDVPIIPVALGGVWGSIFSQDKRASLWGSIKKLRFPIRVSFGEPMIEPTAFEVRQRVTELAADSAQFAVDDDDTLAKRFIRAARKNWSHRAMTDSSGRTLTYGETLIASRLFSEYIQRKHADEMMIGIMLPASIGAAIANLGIVLSGHLPVNLNFSAGREAMDSAVGQCGLKTIVTSKQFLTKAKIEQRPGTIFLEDLMTFGTVQKVKAFLRMRLLPERMLAARAKADDLAAVLFSSGSTGAPKGIMLSHRNLLSNTGSVSHLFQVGNADTIAGVLPFFHSFGFTYTLWFPLLNGASVAYHAQPLDAKGLGDLIEKSKANFLPAPPTFCQAYLRGCTRQQFASLRYVLVGAERLQPALAEAFFEKFGLSMLEGYGATEMSPVISVNVPDCEGPGVKQPGTRTGTVGQPVPGAAAKVVDRETGEPLGPGAEGMLLVKGPNRMLGYLNRPDETAAVLRDGWYVTGDIVTMTEDGFIKIVDRQSRFSKIAGEMIPHNKIEEVLQGLFADTLCVVTGVADERRGEKLVAFVEARGITSKDIWQSLLETDLPKIWIPKSDDIHVIEKLPLLGTGKVDLLAVVQMALAV
jgi:acyl-[acyl-carrier-protein]-phospholipid O-acyltransferase/long-chain-fatty-acid--[acyl-carrier-protein] ligase